MTNGIQIDHQEFSSSLWFTLKARDGDAGSLTEASDWDHCNFSDFPLASRWIKPVDFLKVKIYE
jgi:hypothetical protein